MSRPAVPKANSTVARRAKGSPVNPLPHVLYSPLHQRGVTLVELLVALALSLGVLVGLSAVYIASKQSFRFQETAGRLQEDGTYALETIARDLRMAGFAGCKGVDAITIAAVLTYFPTLSMSATSQGGIQGPNPLAIVESGNGLVLAQPMTPHNFLRGFDNVPASMFTTAPVTSATDSLFFSGGSSNTVSVSAAMATPTSPLAVASNPYAWVSTESYNMIVSNCLQSSLFAGQINAAGTEIAHSTTVVGSASVATNAANNFPSNATYGIDAIVMPLEWNFYYVATGTGASTRSLWRVFYDGKARRNAEEVVSNVESMKLHYGENLLGVDTATGLGCNLAAGAATCAATMQSDTWRTTAAAVTDWSRVVAVRVGLMMVSADNAANPDVATSMPSLLGLPYVAPVGASTTRLRKEFSTTVVVRNRVAAR